MSSSSMSSSSISSSSESCSSSPSLEDGKNNNKKRRMGFVLSTDTDTDMETNSYTSSSQEEASCDLLSIHVNIASSTSTSTTSSGITSNNNNNNNGRGTAAAAAAAAATINRYRMLLTEVVAPLKTWLSSPGHTANPYLTPQEKEQLMLQTGMDKKQLNSWFKDERRRRISLLERRAKEAKWLLFECNLANRIACSLATYDEKTQAASNNNDNNNSNISKSTSRLSLCKQRAKEAKGLLFECNLANRIACSLATYDENRQAEDKKKKVEEG